MGNWRYNKRDRREEVSSEADGAKLNWTGLDCLISPVISGVLSVLATSSDPGFQKCGSEIS